MKEDAAFGDVLGACENLVSRDRVKAVNVKLALSWEIVARIHVSETAVAGAAPSLPSIVDRRVASATNRIIDYNWIVIFSSIIGRSGATLL